MSDIRRERALGAARGLVLGDALGAPASVHRTIREPWVRQMLRNGAAELDESRVVRPVVPFVLSSLGSRPLVGTDDAELFAVAALTLIDARAWDSVSLFGAWSGMVDTPTTWLNAGGRGALLNGAAGLLPPQTGSDNPAFYDDSALPAALAAAIVTASPAAAAQLAHDLAVITHDGVGVQAAAVFAGVLSACMAGATLSDALAADPHLTTSDPWLRDGVDEARSIMRSAPSAFAAIPALVARFAPRTYSHAGTVTETLPLAFAITEVAGGDHEIAMPLAFAVSRHQDSLPALVGALCGSLGSAPAESMLDELAGITVEAVAGLSITKVVDDLLALAESGDRQSA